MTSARYIAIAFLVIQSQVGHSTPLEAFREYWSSFDAYERQILQKEKLKYQKSWDKIKQQYDQDQKALREKKVAKLKFAIETYREQLAKFSDDNSRPDVIFNLAQAINSLASLLANDDLSNTTEYEKEVHQLLKSLRDQYPDYAKKDQVTYLQALLLEQKKDRKQALAAWQRLAVSKKQNIYVVYGNIATGDHYFSIDEPAEALSFYQRGLTVFESLPKRESRYELIRLHYRVAWAAYRSADLEIAIDSASQLLSPGKRDVSALKKAGIMQDAVDLIGDALYEADRFELTKITLKSKLHRDYASAVATRTMQRQLANNQPERAIKVADFSIHHFALALELPQWLEVKSGAHRVLGQTSSENETLEQLAFLLPTKSLWRSQYGNDYKSITNMQQAAFQAAKTMAGRHYNYGIKTGNKNAYLDAAAFYEILIEHEPHGKSSNEWRTKRANSFYFAGKIDEASELYDSMRKDQKLESNSLKVSTYQLVRSREKQWLRSFNKAVNNGKDPKSDPETLGALSELIKSINEFANRFPDGVATVDVLLVAGSANRDHDLYDKASLFWERALVSDPKTEQRAVAIRGLVSAAMKTSSKSRLIETTKRFLRLENWAELGLSLGNELRGVLSTATIDAGKALSGKGNMREAGKLLVRTAEDFPRIPSREKIYRDGAYMLAIGNDWVSAEAAANAYLKAGLKQNAGDMLYLIARAHQFQMRFVEASKSYLKLAKTYPKHPKAVASLKRAEELAAAEDNPELASKASAATALRGKTRSDRVDAHLRTYNYQLSQGQYREALATARARKQSSRSRRDRLESDLLIAKALLELNQGEQAINLMRRIGTRADSLAETIGQTAYASIAGETYFRLGDEERAKFDDFDIFQRRGDINENIRVKTRYFQAMSTNLDKAAATNHPTWATQARYQLGSSAEKLADAIQSIAQKRPDTSERSIERHKATASRLRSLAKKYFSNNVLARRKDPKKLKNNEWVKKSAIKLSGYGDVRFKNKPEFAEPTSISMEIPQQWSL